MVDVSVKGRYFSDLNMRAIRLNSKRHHKTNADHFFSFRILFCYSVCKCVPEVFSPSPPVQRSVQSPSGFSEEHQQFQI
eukprot:3930136-Amphidinium_carterae.1